jgi:drug/metabolite transporter (DMT)-like permease
MKNDVNTNLDKDDETTAIIIQDNTYLNKDNKKFDYSTIEKPTDKTVEKSVIINENTTRFDLCKGLVYMFFSCLLKSMFSILCKYILKSTETLTSYQLLTLKAYFMLIITVVVSLFFFLYDYYNSAVKQSNLFLMNKSSLTLISFRACLSVVSISLTTFALKYLSISDVYAVYYVYPAVVILLSFLILKEKVSAFDYLCLISCFIGVILVIRPEIIFPTQNRGENNPTMILFGLVLLGAIMKACEDIIIRNVGKEVHCFIIPIVYSIVGVVLYPLPLIFSQHKMISDGTIQHMTLFPKLSFNENFIIFMIALFSWAYQAFMAAGLQNENPGRVSMVNYLQVPFMFFADLLIFHKEIIILDVLGVAMVFSFNFGNGIKKVLTRNKNLETMQKLRSGK